jgi:hypothetical protein
LLNLPIKTSILVVAFGSKYATEETGESGLRNYRRQILTSFFGGNEINASSNSVLGADLLNDMKIFKFEYKCPS